MIPKRRRPTSSLAQARSGVAQPGPPSSSSLGGLFLPSGSNHRLHCPCISVAVGGAWGFHWSCAFCAEERNVERACVDLFFFYGSCAQRCQRCYYFDDRLLAPPTPPSSSFGTSLIGP
uniref:Uncharacterized protein n=1 Tax=Panagrellus redivivus TaxID=6233 RepID=A0A7E4W2R1_PANRE